MPATTTTAQDWVQLLLDRPLVQAPLTALELAAAQPVRTSMAPIKVLANDQRYYMMKKREGGQALYDGQPLTPHAGFALVAEFVVARLGNLIAAPVAPVSLISISPRLVGRVLRTEPWGQEQPLSYHLTEEVGVASRYIDHDCEIPGPPEFLDKADNAIMAARMIALLDLAMGSDEQFLYARNTLRIVSFDHGCYFSRRCMGKPVSELIAHIETPYAMAEFGLPTACAPELRKLAHQLPTQITRSRIAAILSCVPTQWGGHER